MVMLWVWRLYREMGLQLRNKAPERRVKAKLREGRSGAVEFCRL
jgi:putative transposase